MKTRHSTQFVAAVALRELLFPNRGRGVVSLASVFSSTARRMQHSGNQSSRLSHSSPSLINKVIFPGSFHQWLPPQKGTRLKVDSSNGQNDRLNLGDPNRFVASGDSMRDLDHESQTASAHGRVIGDTSRVTQSDQSSDISLLLARIDNARKDRQRVGGHRPNGVAVPFASLHSLVGFDEKPKYDFLKVARDMKPGTKAAAYATWIAEQLGNPDGSCAVYGKCESVTLAMGEYFQELQRVRGHYICPIWGERAHWWMVDTEGNVIDPTAAQFPSRGCGEYIPWVEGCDEPTGICPECGGYVYDDKTVCSSACHAAFARSCAVHRDNLDPGGPRLPH